MATGEAPLSQGETALFRSAVISFAADDQNLMPSIVRRIDNAPLDAPLSITKERVQDFHLQLFEKYGLQPSEAQEAIGLHRDRLKQRNKTGMGQ